MTAPATYHTDTSDMLIPHGLFRKALGSAGEVIGGVSTGDGEHLAAVTSYFDNVLRFLDAHHGGEDAVVWPVLTERCRTAADLIASMEAEHESIHSLRERAGTRLTGWTGPADAAGTAALVESLAALRTELEAHFAEEEEKILPLASSNMSPEEWGQLPGHAMRHFTGDKLWLVLGLVFEQMTDEQRTYVLGVMPPPVVEMWTTTGRSAFGDFIGRVRQAARVA